MIEGEARAAAMQAAAAEQRALSLAEEVEELRQELAQRPTQVKTQLPLGAAGTARFHAVSQGIDCSPAEHDFCLPMLLQSQMETLKRQADIMERQLAKAAAEKAASQAREANRCRVGGQRPAICAN